MELDTERDQHEEILALLKQEFQVISIRILTMATTDPKLKRLHLKPSPLYLVPSRIHMCG